MKQLFQWIRIPVTILPPIIQFTRNLLQNVLQHRHEQKGQEIFRTIDSTLDARLHDRVSRIIGDRCKAYLHKIPIQLQRLVT